MSNKKIYKMRVIRGAFLDPRVLDEMGAKTVEDLGRDEWISIDEIEVDMDDIRKLQKEMIRHYDDADVPWYMDGYEKDNRDSLIVAFGADDGEDGKVFTLDRKDAEKIKEVVDYGTSKGIPKEQMGFYKI